MSIITELLKKEYDLNELLNSKPRPDDIREQFKALFTNTYYKNTQKFLCTTLFNGVVNNFVQQGDNTSFTIDCVILFKEIGDYQFDEIGTLENSGLCINGVNPFPNIDNKEIRHILIDEDNKEIAFILYSFDENNNKINIEHISYNYTDISFIKGQEKLYEEDKKKQPKM